MRTRREVFQLATALLLPWKKLAAGAKPHLGASVKPHTLHLHIAEPDLIWKVLPNKGWDVVIIDPAPYAAWAKTIYPLFEKVSRPVPHIGTEERAKRFPQVKRGSLGMAFGREFTQLPDGRVEARAYQFVIPG